MIFRTLSVFTIKLDRPKLAKDAKTIIRIFEILEEEQQNLVRVTDILSELTRQLGPLERQSETARVYLKKKEELKILDVNMYLAESAHTGICGRIKRMHQ